MKKLELNDVLFFDSEFDVIAEEQEKLDNITKNMSDEDIENLDRLLCFVRDRTEAKND